MPSFDVAVKLDFAEVDNAVNQAKKEVATRYDFRGTNTEIDRISDEEIVLKTSDKEHLNTTYRVLVEKFVKRGVSVRALDPQEIEAATKNTVRQKILLKQGIPVDKGKDINRRIKDSKLKVSSTYQDEQVRVTGKNKDDLQAAIRLLRAAMDELELDLQFLNFRD